MPNARSRSSATRADIRKYLKAVTQRGVVPEHVSDHPIPHEKVVVQTLPYSLRVPKSLVDWQCIDAGVRRRFDQMLAAGYLVDEGERWGVSREGFFWYPNMMYYLTTDEEKKILDAFMQERLSQEARLDGPMDTPVSFFPRPGRTSAATTGAVTA